MTKKDYIRLARFIGRAEAEMNLHPAVPDTRAAGFVVATNAVINALVDDNEKFDRKKFLDAIGRE